MTGFSVDQCIKVNLQEKSQRCAKRSDSDCLHSLVSSQNWGLKFTVDSQHSSLRRFCLYYLHFVIKNCSLQFLSERNTTYSDQMKVSAFIQHLMTWCLQSVPSHGTQLCRLKNGHLLRNCLKHLLLKHLWWRSKARVEQNVFWWFFWSRAEDVNLLSQQTQRQNPVLLKPLVSFHICPFSSKSIQNED